MTFPIITIGFEYINLIPVMMKKIFSSYKILNRNFIVD